MTREMKSEAIMNHERATDLEDILVRLVALLRELPVAQRGARERQRSGGWLYPTHEAVVDRIRKGLLSRPEIFPDVPDAAGLGVALTARQARAGAWLALRDQLRAFAEACQDEAILEQGLAVQEAEHVMELVLCGLRQRDRWPGLDHGARLGAMLMGLVWRREAMKGKGRPGKRKDREGEELTPRQAQAAEARRQERKEALRALFAAWMRKR